MRVFSQKSICDSRVLDGRNKTKTVTTIDRDRTIHACICTSILQRKIYTIEITISAYTADIYTLIIRDRKTDWHARLYNNNNNNKYVCFRLICPFFLSFIGRQCLIRFSFAPRIYSANFKTLMIHRP